MAFLLGVILAYWIREPAFTFQEQSTVILHPNIPLFLSFCFCISFPTSDYFFLIPAFYFHSSVTHAFPAFQGPS